MQSDLPRPNQQHAAKWRKVIKCIIDRQVYSTFRTWNNLGGQYVCKVQVWLSGVKKSKNQVWNPTITGHFTQGGRKLQWNSSGWGKNDLELRGRWMFSQKSNVIFVQYHLDYCKSKNYHSLVLSFLSRKVKATEVLENRNVILTINKAGGGRGVRLKLLFWVDSFQFRL